MAKLEWNKSGTRLFEAGVDRGVIYVDDGEGVAWNGLINVGHAPSGGDLAGYYQDGIKYYQESTQDEPTFSLEAYTYPDEFEPCMGLDTSQGGLSYGYQPRAPFHMTYRTLIGNDEDSIEHGYKIHFIYNAMADHASADYSTLGESLDAMTFNWTLSTVPILTTDRKRTSYLSLDSTKLDSDSLEEIEALIYGDQYTAPKMPRPWEIEAILDKNLIKIAPHSATGIFSLDTGKPADMKGSLTLGVYELLKISRLTPSPSRAGLYSLES